jgi:hypothetical protein
MIEKFQSLSISKPAISRLFGLGVALVVAGVVTATVAVIAAFASGVIAFGGPQFVTIDVGPAAWTIAALVVASLCGAIGTVIAIAAWAAALLNTSRLEDKTWFTTLLVLGLVSLGWVAMFAYVAKGPDGTATQAGSTAVAQG